MLELFSLIYRIFDFSPFDMSQIQGLNNITTYNMDQPFKKNMDQLLYKHILQGLK